MGKIVNESRDIKGRRSRVSECEERDERMIPRQEEKQRQREFVGV